MAGLGQINRRRAISSSPTEGKGYIKFKDEAVFGVLMNNGVSSDGVGITKDDAARVTSIEAWFKGNTEIKTFSELRYFTNLSSISSSAFSGCTSLQMIVCNVDKISSSAFSGCTSLQMIVCERNEPPAMENANAIPNAETCLIYVPKDSVELYQSSTNWNTYAATILPIIDSADLPIIDSADIEVKGLVGDGSAYINTGHYLQGDEVISVIAFNGNSGVNNITPIGARDGTYATAIYRGGSSGAISTQWLPYYGSKSYLTIVNRSPSPSMIAFSLGPKVFSHQKSSVNITSGGNLVNASFHIFTDWASRNKFVGAVRKVVLKSGEGALRHLYQPIYRHGVLGYKDQVTGEFFENAGSGSFSIEDGGIAIYKVKGKFYLLNAENNKLFYVDLM